MHIRTLIDQGAMSDNYVDTKIATELVRRGLAIRKKLCRCVNGYCKETVVRVCSAFTGACKSVEESLAFNWTYTNLISMKEETIKIEASIIDSPHEMIIGRGTIKEHVLALKLHTQFFRHLSDAKAVLVGLESAEPSLMLPQQQHITTKTAQPNAPRPGDVKDKSALLDEVTVDDGVEARWKSNIQFFTPGQPNKRNLKFSVTPKRR